VLQLNPEERWTPKQALQHSLVTGTNYDAGFQPPRDDPVPAIMRVPPSPLSPGIGVRGGNASGGSAAASSSAGSTPTRGSGPPGHRAKGSAGAIHAGRHRFPTSAFPGQSLLIPPCAGSGQDGSRGSSPWHLPSPMSQMSTASDRLQSSQPSGSDSCGWGGSVCNFDGCASEDHSLSDTSGSHWPRSAQPSDSDCVTPQTGRTSQGARSSSGGAGGEERSDAAKDPQAALWKNIKTEITRHQAPRRLDTALSPGRVGTTGGSFREAMGIAEPGPVIGHGARRDSLGSWIAPHASASGEEGAAGTGVGGSGSALAFSPLQRTSSASSGAGNSAAQAWEQSRVRRSTRGRARNTAAR
jgi:hypothetical protein